MKKKILFIAIVLIIVIIGIAYVCIYRNKDYDKGKEDIVSNEIVRNNIEEINNADNNISGQYYDKKITDLISAKESIESVKDELNLSSIDDLNDGEENTFGTVFNTYNFDQYYNGLRYYGHSVKAYTDKDGNSKGIINSYNAIEDFNTIPNYSPEELESIALEKSGKENKIKNNELVIFDLDANTKTLAYIFNMANGATVIIDANSKEVLAYDDGFECLTDSDLEKYKIDDELAGMLASDLIETENVKDSYIMSDRNKRIFMCQYNNDDSSYNYYIWKNAKDIEKEEDFKLREDTINTVSKVYDYYNKTFNYKSFDGKGTDINICTDVEKINGKDISNSASYSYDDAIHFGSLNYFNKVLEVVRTRIYTWDF